MSKKTRQALQELVDTYPDYRDQTEYEFKCDLEFWAEKVKAKLKELVS